MKKTLFSREERGRGGFTVNLGLVYAEKVLNIFNPLIPNITSEFLNLPTEFMLGDHMLYSHDFSD